MWHYQEQSVHSSGCLIEAKTSARKGSCPRGASWMLEGAVCFTTYSPSPAVGESAKTPPGHIFVSPPFPKHCSSAILVCHTNLNIFGNILFRGGSKLVPKQLWFLRQNLANWSQTGDCGLDYRGIHLCKQGKWAFQHFLSWQCVWKTCLLPRQLGKAANRGGSWLIWTKLVGRETVALEINCCY